MKALKTIATGLSATMLATTMLAGAANAAPKPQIKFNTPMVAPKANIIKPIRPNIARPLVQVRVNRDRLQPKAGQDDDPAGNNVAPSARQSGKAVIAILTPPARLPQPRPEFEDQANDIKDMIGADGLGDINPDDFRVGLNPHDPDGALAGLGLPGTGDEAGDRFGENNAPTGPAAGTPGGSGGPWDNVEPGIGDVGNPVGGNSHGKDAPDTAPGVRVTPGSIGAIIRGIASGPSSTTPGEQTEERTLTRRPSETTTVSMSDSETVTKRDSGDGNVVVTTTRTGNGRVTESTTQYINGEIQTREVWTAYNNGTRTHVYFNYNSGRVFLQHTGIQDRSWMFAQPRGDTGTYQPRHRLQLTDVWKLYDPDYVEGGGYVPPNCGSYECNKARQRQANPGLALKEAKDGATKVFPGPDGGNTAPTNGGEPIVSQHDLLSHYDPDFDQAGGGDGVRNAPPRIQSD
jgi:hypothetical protein